MKFLFGLAVFFMVSFVGAMTTIPYALVFVAALFAGAFAAR